MMNLDRLARCQDINDRRLTAQDRLNRLSRLFVFAIVMCCCLTSAATAHDDVAEASTTPTDSSADDVADMARLIADRVPEIPSEHFQSAFQRVVQLVRQPNAHLQEAMEHRDDWRRFLRWDKLVAQADLGPEMDPTVLENIGFCFRAAVPMLDDRYDLGHFADTLQDVAHQLRMLSTTREEIADHLRLLAKALDAYSREPSIENRSQVEQHTMWLAQHGQGAGLLDGIAAQHANPNLYVFITQQAIARQLDRTINRANPVDEVILGSRVVGTSQTDGRITTALIPHADKVSLNLSFVGNITSQTNGYQDAARVQSRGDTFARIEKQISISEHAIWTQPATGLAKTRSQMTGFSWGRVLGRRIAYQRANQVRAQADRVSEQRVAERIKAMIDQRIDPVVSDANLRFINDVRVPLLARGNYPRSIHMHSRENDVHLSVTHAGPGQLAASTLPKQAPAGADIVMQVHQSLLNNTTHRLFAGKTLAERNWGKRLKDYMTSVPAALQQQDEEKPWSITFAQRRPLSVQFHPDRVTFELRADGFSLGDKKYPGMHIAADYFPESNELGGFYVRAEKLMLTPPTKQKGERLGAREAVFRSLLRKRFDPIFANRMDIKHIPMPQDWSQDRSIEILKTTLDEGWLTLHGQLYNHAQLPVAGLTEIEPTVQKVQYVK